jgi:hypothetical protein
MIQHRDLSLLVNLSELTGQIDNFGQGGCGQRFDKVSDEL